jgi:hypothetical protein
MLIKEAVVETKRDTLNCKEQEAIASMASISSHEHAAHGRVNARKNPLLMRHTKLKKTTGDLFQARVQHDARLNMPFFHETANKKRQHMLTQIKEHRSSVAHSKKQQRRAPVAAASMGDEGAAQAMQEFRHAQDALVQARNRVLALHSRTLHQNELFQLARRSPLLDGEVCHSQYVVLDSCPSAASFASFEHTIAMHHHALYTHRSAAGARTQQPYPADGAQQGLSARPASGGGAGSCTPSVVHSQGYADHVAARATTKQALFQSILKNQALKQEVERLAESNRQLAETNAAIYESTRPWSTPRAAYRSARMSL